MIAIFLGSVKALDLGGEGHSNVEELFDIDILDLIFRGLKVFLIGFQFLVCGRRNLSILANFDFQVS